jgi:hypothetical protein
MGWEELDHFFPYCALLEVLLLSTNDTTLPQPTRLHIHDFTGFPSAV